MSTKRQIIKARNAARRAALAAQKAVEKFEAGMLSSGDAFVKNGIEYITDKKGRAVRKPSRENPVKAEEVRHVLLNTRAVELDDVLMVCGEWITKWLLDNDMLRRDQKVPTLLWVTTNAAFRYNLPRPVVGGVACKFV